MPFDDFEKYCYDILKAGFNYFPDAYKPKVDKMISGKFLRSCITYEGLEFTFRSINKRAKFSSNFLVAAEELKLIESEFDNLFNDFFPDLQAYVKQECGC